MLFELNCDFHFQVFYEKDNDPCFQIKSVNKLVNELKKLTIVYKK